MKLRLIMVGRTEKGFVAEGLDHYIGRVSHREPVELVILPEAGKGDPAFQQRIEGDRILTALRPSEKLVILDERGKQLTSVQFAQQLQNWRDQGIKNTAFVIGGAFGLSEAVKAKAEMQLSLSSMTFPHQLVRVLFAEQLYRAYSIIEGKPYHH